MISLIIDDDDVSRKTLSLMMETHGEVDNASGGEEGISLFKTRLDNQTPYDIICLDIMMPRMNGQEVLRIIREEEDKRKIPQDRRVKIIMTTSLSDPDNVMKAFHQKCDNYLVKPISKKNLDQALLSIGILFSK